MITRLEIPGLSRAASVRLIVCIFILLVGIFGMTALANLKETPAEVKYQKQSLRVQTITAKQEDIQVRILGYGEVRPLDVVPISPEIPGRISRVHPRLEPGEIIGKDEVLFEIDPCNYKAVCKQARATVEQCENAILKLQIQHAADLKRLESIKRNRELAELQLDRMQSLFETHGVVAQSQVESTEQSYNTISELYDQLAQAVELYSIQSKDASDSLSSAQAELEIAEANLKRCVVRAPFEGRTKDVSIEAGQYVIPGLQVLTLANDAILELHVPIDSRDAQRWLRFKDDRSQENKVWFNGLEEAPCRIRWTEDQSGNYSEGRLHRVVKFEQQTRTLLVAIRINTQESPSEDSGKLPLVEGMFCSVEIPGKVISDAFRLPREAVSFEKTVYVSENRRLKTVPVQVAQMEGEHAIVSAGLERGDLIITTKLVDPLENCLLETEGEIGGESE